MTASNPTEISNEERVRPVALEVREWKALALGNESAPGHYRTYNGLIRLTGAGERESAFREHFAGLNYEVVAVEGIDPQVGRIHAMEPRYAYSEPVKLQGENTARFYQPPTPLNGVETEIIYKAVEPRYLDIEVTYRLHRRTRERAEATAWWASYMNAPADPSLYFLGHTEDDPRTRWLRIHRAGHGPEYPTLASNMENLADPGVESWQWDFPFYYGRIRDRIYIMMFDGVERNRIAYSPTGGDNYDVPMPAWDFIHVMRDYQTGQSYRFQARMVYTRFIGREQALEEYERWSGNKTSA